MEGGESGRAFSTGTPTAAPSSIFLHARLHLRVINQRTLQTRCLAPNWEACKDAEDMGEGKGDMQGSALGCVQRKLGILWRTHQEHRGREPGYCCGQLGQNIAVLSAIDHRTNCPYRMPLLPQETFLYEQQEWWERKIIEHPKSIADITCRKVFLSTILGVTSSNKPDSDMAKT